MTALALASSFCCQGGAFEAAFAGAGVDFDRERGAFRVHRNCVGEVELVGEGLARYWMARTLERACTSSAATSGLSERVPYPLGFFQRGLDGRIGRFRHGG